MKPTRIQKILISVIIVLLFIAIFPGNIFSKYGYDTILYSHTQLVKNPIVFVGDIFRSISKVGELEKEKKELISKVNNFTYQKQMIEQLQEKNKQLEKLLEMKEKTIKYQPVAARIIGKNIDNLKFQCTIDVGEKDGIAIGDLVIDHQGVIGKISKTTQNSSKVSFFSLNNSTMRLIVRLQQEDGSYIEGILDGYDKKSNQVLVRVHKENVTLKKEGKVLTTQGFDIDLLVGTITVSEKLVDGLGEVVYVKLASNVENIDHVLVLTKEQNDS